MRLFNALTMRMDGVKRSIAVAFVAAALWGCFLGALLHRIDGGVGALVVAGSGFVDRASAPDCLPVYESGGYDGQFYFRLAVAPFDTSERVQGVRFDYPVYRAQRMVYPLVCRLFGGGDPCLTLWVMPLANIAILGVLAFAGAQFALRLGVSAWWGLIVALWPGFAFSLARDTTEPLACALLVCAMAALAARSHRLATTFLCLAVLTRETVVLAAVCIGCHGVVVAVRERRWSPLIAMGALPPLAFVAFKLFLFWHWRLPVNFGAKRVLGIPLGGAGALLRDSLRAGTHGGRVQAVEILLLGAIAVIAIVAARSSKAPRVVKCVCLTYVAFLACLTSEVWIEDWAFMRATAEGGVLAALVVMGGGRWTRWVGAGLFAVSSLATAVELLLR